MKTTVSIAIQVVGSAIILVGGYFGFVGLMAMKPEPGETPQREILPTVSLVKVQSHDAGVTIRVDGIVVPYREIPVAAEVAGRVVKKNEACRAGHFVKKGTLLAQIEKRDYQLDVDRITQELEQAKASLDELAEDIKGNAELARLAAKEVELADKEWKRQQKLGEDVVSKSKLDQLERAKVTAQLAHARTKNQLTLLKKSKNRLQRGRDLATKRLERAKLDLERTEIRAPIDGVIVKDDVETDAFVQRGKVVYTIEDTSRVEVRCNLQMDDLFWIWQANPAVKKRDARGDYQLPVVEGVEVTYRFAGEHSGNYIWKGRLDRFDGIGLDEQTRTAPCRVVVTNPRKVQIHSTTKGNPRKRTEGPPALVRGMFVGVAIRVQPKNVKLLRMPETALRPGKVVWKVNADNKLTIHPIRFVQMWKPIPSSNTTGRLNEILVLSKDGQVSAGNQLVTSPLAFVKSGMTVKVSK